MLENSPSSSGFLIGRCAAFYEEVARMKLAAREGRLPVYLGVEETKAASGAQLAALASGRLHELLAQQTKALRAVPSTDADAKACAIAQYIMAALADEIFILELDWAGRNAWVHWLLEYALFRSRAAGREFFQQADQLLRGGPRSALHVDLAVVFLLALRLGFKGQYRGDPGGNGGGSLRDYSARLLQFIRARERRPGDAAAAFPQSRLLRGEKEQRITPLSRWYLAGAAGLVLYLVASSVVWVLALRPFYVQFG